jgi:hypothetical protein
MAVGDKHGALEHVEGPPVHGGHTGARLLEGVRCEGGGSGGDTCDRCDAQANAAAKPWRFAAQPPAPVWCKCEAKCEGGWAVTPGR